MNRRVGLEKKVGLGGSMRVSEASQRNLNKAEDLCRKRQPEKAVPYLVEAMKDKNNLDAYVQAAFLAPTLDDSVEFIEGAMMIGRKALLKHLGQNCFDDDGPVVGQFWSVIETRPYMRVLQALVRLAYQNKLYNKSADTIIEMLRLCPGDDMSQRTWLGSILIRVDRASDALSFARKWLENPGTILPRGGTVFGLNSDELLPADVEKSISEFSIGALVYTAALAAFKLWGNCPLACQYLRIAAKVNPTILMRILANIRQPTELSMLPRSMNGTEDAHDYLYLTQDLWMEPDVWNWANEHQDIKKSILKICSREGCNSTETTAAQFKRCASCKLVSYCGPSCQKADWKSHKPNCLVHKQTKQVVRDFAKGKMAPEEKI